MKITSRAINVALVIAFSVITPMTCVAGATVYHANYDTGTTCFDTGTSDGTRYCFQQKGNWTKVVTPSGVTNYMLKGTVVNTTNYGGYIQQTTNDSNEKMQYKSDELQKGHSFTTTSVVNSFNGQCTEYTVEYDLFFGSTGVTQTNQKFSSTPC